MSFLRSRAHTTHILSTQMADKHTKHTASCQAFLGHVLVSSVSLSILTVYSAAGFLGTAGEYEVLARSHRKAESALQRYNRLNAEVNDLLRDLEEAEKVREGCGVKVGGGGGWLHGGE